MIFQEWIYARFKENCFELEESVKLEMIMHFAAPFTGGDDYDCPKGLQLIPTGPMREDAIYLTFDSMDDATWSDVEEFVKSKYAKLFSRWSGISFSITTEQLNTYPLKFIKGSLAKVLKLIEMSNEHSNYNLKDEQLTVFDEMLNGL